MPKRRSPQLPLRKFPTLTAAQRCALVQRVLGKACDESETWREHHLGSNLAYLALAITDTDEPEPFVDWSADLADPTLGRIRADFERWFPAADPVWQFIFRKSADLRP